MNRKSRLNRQEVQYFTSGTFLLQIKKKGMKSMFEKVQSIIAEQLGVSVDSVTLDSSLVEDLGADSLDMVELIMAFSDEFDIDIPDDAAEGIATVGDVVDYLKKNS